MEVCMKKNKLLLTLILWFSCGVAELVFSKENSTKLANEVKKARKNQYNQLTSQLERIQYCTQELKSFSSRVLAVQNKISQTNSQCLSFETVEQLKSCIDLKKDLIKQTTSIAQSIAGSELDCPIFDSHFALIQIDSSINALKISLDRLNSLHTFLILDAIFTQKTYNTFKYPTCRLDIGLNYTQMINWALQLETAKIVGDTYIFEQGLSALEVLKDYITIQAKICINENVLGNEDNQNLIASIQEVTVNSQNLHNQLISKFANEDLNLWPEKWCEHLKNKRNINLELCEEPLNNPSWAYSVHHQVEQIMNNKE